MSFWIEKDTCVPPKITVHHMKLTFLEAASIIIVYSSLMSGISYWRRYTGMRTG